SRARKGIRLSVERLEQRDVPSAPSALFDVPTLVPFFDMSYSETHTLSKSFSHTATVDELGSADAGTYTIEIVGTTQLSDKATGSGGVVVSATGTLSTSAHWDLIIHGTHSLTGDTITDESYSETGAANSSYDVVYNDGYGDTVQLDGGSATTWSLSWSANVVDNGLPGGETLFFTSLSY